jgi:hypothetical protein
MNNPPMKTRDDVALTLAGMTTATIAADMPDN